MRHNPVVLTLLPQTATWSNCLTSGCSSAEDSHAQCGWRVEGGVWVEGGGGWCMGGGWWTVEYVQWLQPYSIQDSIQALTPRPRLGPSGWLGASPANLKLVETSVTLPLAHLSAEPLLSRDLDRLVLRLEERPAGGVCRVILATEIALILQS